MSRTLRAMWAGARGGPDPDWLRRVQPPDNEIPVAVPLHVVLARTDRVALALGGLTAYSTGLCFDLVLRCRPGAIERHRSIAEVIGLHGPGPTGLLLGVAYPDGRRAMSAGGGPPSDASGELLLTPRGGSSGELSADQSWWLSPLPPPGRVRVVVRCDPLGIPDTTTELDGAAIAAAATRVVELWPWELPPERAPFQTPPPDVPPDSWFAR